jgi:phosphatidylinositol alpha-mannosyltransferase
MRIGLVCPYTWEVPGGVQAHIDDLARALMAMGHDVSVIAPAEGGMHLPDYVVDAGRAVPVSYNGSVARVVFGPLSTARVRRWLREGQFDVVHVHEPLAPSLGLLTLWNVRRPVAATFHAAMERSRWLNILQPALQPAIEKISARIAVSPAARRQVEEHLGGTTVLIPNGVDVGRFERAEPLPGWPGTDGTIAFLGRMDEPRKGLAVLLEAFEILAPQRPGLRLLVAGPGDQDEVREALPTPLRERIEMLGFVDDETKGRVYRSADVYCAPNLGGESFGVVLLEAMAAGTPVVASDLDAFRRVLDDGRCGRLVPVNDAPALAAALAAALDDPTRSAEMVAHGRTVVRRYDWRSVAAKVVAVYETLLEAQPQR